MKTMLNSLNRLSTLSGFRTSVTVLQGRISLVEANLQHLRLRLPFPQEKLDSDQHGFDPKQCTPRDFHAGGLLFSRWWVQVIFAISKVHSC